MAGNLKIIVIILCAGLIHGRLVYQAGIFPYSKCKQTSNDVHCETLNITKGRQENPSIWPPGPYAVLMSKFGCPERHSQGWRNGVLKFKTTSLESDWNINFCVKIRHEPELDNEIWIPGTYSVFRIGETCPKGFSEFEQIWNSLKFLGVLSTFGHVPNFKIGNDTGNSSIVFNMCERNSTTNKGSAQYGMLQTDFLLGKKKDDICMQFDNTSASEVSIFDDFENSYCFYMYNPFEKLDDENVALGKPANMSSMFGLKAIANNAVDGNLSLQHEPHQLCFHTQRTIYNWWYVDLHNLYKIERVKLYNRGDGFDYRARQIEILVGNTLDNLFKVGFVESMGLTLTIYMPNNTVGRYVKLFQIVEEYLHFCEIEVYASLVFKIETFSQLMSEFLMSRGILSNSDNAHVWYRFDLRRTLPVFEVEVQMHGENENGNDQTKLDIFERGMYISCLYGNEMWGFLHHEATACNERIYFHLSTLRLFLRNVRARFITLMFNEASETFQTIKTKESIKFFLFDLPEGGQCNEDLGMIDGSIQDLQLTASSWLPEYPVTGARPSRDGWCAEVTDSKAWIMVDLIALTMVEAISIWNKENAQNITEESGKEGRSYFTLYYGTDIDELTMYKDMHFNINISRTMADVQTFVLLNPVDTRYVKLEFQDTSTCLQFELQGCKLSGIPTLNCFNTSVMFATETTITTRRKSVVENDVSIDDCSTLCLQDNNCSVARYNEGICEHYMSTRFAEWQIGDLESGKWTAKLCVKEPIALFPTLLHTEGEMSTNMEYVRQNTVITSIGYPFTFETGQKYKWLIQLPSLRYGRLTFTNVSLNHKHKTCTDRLLISKEIQTETNGREFDHRYNNRVFVIETSDSLLFLTFFSCLSQEKITHRGFRAVITGEEIPACLSVDSDMDWSEGRYDLCTEPEMILTSMSVLNLPFENVEETWDIQAGEHNTVQLHILDFYVVCPHVPGGNSSKFAVADKYEERVFCNTNRLPDVIYTKTSDIRVRFRMRVDSAITFIRTEGFRLQYSTISYSLEMLKDLKNSTTKVCSTAFMKCYRVLPSLKTWSEAAESCLKCDQRLVSVQSKYEMDFINYLLRDMKYRDSYVKQEGFSYDSSFVAHIGLRRHTNSLGKKAFMWETTSPITYAAWRAGNPTGRKDCARTNFELFSNKTWESEHCSTDVAQFYICESLMNDETDEDEEELCTCPRGWIQNEGSCYYFSTDNNDKRNWTNASKACKHLDSYLVEVENAAENKFMESVIIEKGASYWMGATDLINEGVFVWNNSGNAVGYTDWLFGEPNNWNGNEDCAQYWWEDTYRRWKDESCSEPVPYICEKNAATIVINCEDSFSNSHRNVKSTYTGNDCQHWNSLTASARDDFRARFPKLSIPVNANNYCQDPGSSGILWCYTKSSQINLWEPCFIQTPSLEDADAESIRNTSSDKFECQNGNTIPSLNRCDGVFHCNDFSDEAFCSNKGQYLTNTMENQIINQPFGSLEKAPYFLCGSKEWISVLATCDDVIDCLDASDELNCSSNTKDFSETGSCDQNSCADIDSVCDFTPENTNAAEEFRELRPCDTGHYMCDSRQCISMDKRCNAIADCTDESDERRCDSCQDSFHCDNVKCIPLRLLCDKYPDCEDGSDETSCFPESLSSCDQWWERGYKTSGNYMIEGIEVYCDFSPDTTAGIIAIAVHISVDVAITENDGHIYATSFMDSSQQQTETDIRNIIYRDGYKCYLKVQTTCKFHTEASVIEKLLNEDSTHECQCTVNTFKTTKSGDWVWQKVQETEETIGGNASSQCKTHSIVETVSNSVYYNITRNGNFRFDNQVQTKHLPVEITPGPITCIYEYRSKATTDMVGCEGDDEIIPLSLLCIYDLDPSGFLNGCRSGSHLQNCGKFSCPEYTVKCPGSYCVPLKFVCDRKIDCPEGHDELQCTCTNSANEALILVEDTSNQTESSIAAVKLAEQFYNIDSHVRLLHYKTLTPLDEFNLEHRLLEIREERIQSVNRVSECRYKSMARTFLENIRFETNASKSIVFIEDSLESSKVAELMFSNPSRPDVRIYRVLKDVKFNLKHYRDDFYRFVKDVYINRWNALFSIGYKRFPEICKADTEVVCSGGYRCSSSKQCIPLEQVCDGIAQCNGKDDERLCDFYCPSNCTCVGYSVNCKAIDLKFSDVMILSINTQSADLSGNHDIQDALVNSTLRFPYMIRLNLSSTQLEIVTEMGFLYLNNLQCLDLGYNRIKMLPENTFSNLKNLLYLSLDGNFELEVISATAFTGLKRVKSLRITGTNLKRISMYTFSDLNLQSIDISNNLIEEIEDYAFNNTLVEKIDFRGNNILNFNKRIFNGVVSLRELLTPAFKFCCIRPCYVEENGCYPRKNEFSSCGDLMRHPVLQAVLWLVGIAALFGNFGSIIYRLVYDRARLKIGYGIFVTNLAAADFLMGVYLIMIAVVDSLYRNRYIFMDDQWRNSTWCVVAGVLSTVSSEASVLFLCLITLDRLLVIKYPFGTIRFGPKRAYMSCFVSWVIALMLAVIPLIHTSHFQNKFYSRSGVCIALPLTRDKPPGWVYSVSIFVGLNFCTFILVAFGQVSIFMEIRRANVQKTQKSRKRDLQVARNLIIVATTDFMCWFPVGLMGIMALNGYPIPGDVYAWTAVFILPLNSALNPILYTLTAIIGRQSFNPSTEEQTRTEMLRETGSVIVQYHNLTRYVRIKSVFARTGKRIQDLQENDECLSTMYVTSICFQLSRFLYLLHDSSVALDRLSACNTYVKLYKKDQRVSIVIDSKMAIAYDENELQDNMYQFGKLLQRLIALVRQKKKMQAL